MFLRGWGLKKNGFMLALAVGAVLNLLACGGSSKPVPSGLKNRVIASQDVTATTIFGNLVILNGEYDVLTSVPPISAGSSPGLMAISPDRNIVAAFDSASNSVYSADTTTEKGLGQVHLSAPTFSMTIPTSAKLGFAAVPAAVVNGYNVYGAVVVMDLSSPGGITSTIAVNSARTLVPNTNGNQLLVFSDDSDVVTLLTPARALAGTDLSCYDPNNPPPNPVCTIITNPGFSRPVYAVVNGSTAYILNCGIECGGTQQASVQTLDLNTLAVGTPVRVNGATYAYQSGSKLYVAGNGSSTGPRCSSLTNPINPKTAATYCGTLDIVNLTTMTDPYFNAPASEIAIPDGYHDHMDISINGQLFVGSSGCQNVGDVNFPNGEVRGCLAIFNTNNGSLIIPPDNGDVKGLQSFTSREVEYVAQGGNLRVYDTTIDALLINEFLPLGTISVVGNVQDIKAIDFF
jgi:hypothetical protein